MVWFYRARRPYLHYNGRTFQSHFGLILSGHRLRESAGWSSFNPILVWFYLIELKDAGLKEFFQSHFGLILSLWEIQKRLSISCFQSHFGLILSFSLFIWGGWRWVTFNPILVWFYPKRRLANIEMIKSILKEVLVWKYSFNPILVWFYQGNLCSPGSLPVVLLSIPFWSDFILNRPEQIWKQQQSFNPILVWFYHQH